MRSTSTLKFELINGVSKSDIENNQYVIYAHACSQGVYVGMSNDPVKRWEEHYSDALNEHSHNADDLFRAAIRRCRNSFKHYIVAVANFEKSARNKEASAIKFYGDHLNMKQESETIERDYQFRPFGSQIGIPLVLNKKSRIGTTANRSDKERTTVIGEIFIEYGRKRVRIIGGQPFAAGMRIECPRDERENFNVGDRVRVNVALSEKRGKKYLVSAKTAKLVLVR